MKICFIMYPWARIEPETDSTLRLIHECASRGHTVALSTVNNMTIRDSIASVFCDVIKKNSKVPDNIQSFYKKVNFRRSQLPLAGFDVIFMRANPPLDTLALNFLDSVRGDTFIMNDLDGLRIANNKLYTASFRNVESEFIPATHVSKNREYLERIFDESENNKMILKPLDGFGGRGVIVLEKAARQSFSSLLDFYIGGDEHGKDSNYVILQDYIEGAEKGDVRILMLNGEPIGAMKRVPAANDVRSNVHAGGTVVKHKLTAQEKKLCKYIGPKLVRDGLYFTGIDVIGGKLIEVNVLSPGGITRINKLNRAKLQQDVIDFVENVVNAKELVMSRKSQFRQVIEDADAI
ncbi:Glutathione synthetase [Piscirickettsia salmonis]|uniref:glutathione synthase n=1 Tax=Piscirickettsia salmonis TaxID=1238 RepID=UPI0012BA6590|nr:glutathione synthase [Piscirickettsia salmonis]QGP53876.1 Glutathione synthetase [Piscirickettsia salmonis]QGP60227.1 Glutathione synthetase [Piscirickettsia salmonis]QGP63454.1 Glutathione synthetase [Piscirickettsia salmonis]